MDNLDEEKYEIIPIYIAKDYTWYAGGLLRHIDSFNNFNLIEKYARKVNLINTQVVVGMQVLVLQQLLLVVMVQVQLIQKLGYVHGG